ncbi:hypothetical protein Q7P37_000566 [Cladosporium fusiforme]
MPRRARQSTATASVAPSPSQRTAATQSSYERPQFTLNPDAQRALADLARKHNLKQLDAKFQDAQDAVTVSAGEINDRLTDKEKASKRLRAKQQASQDGDADGSVEAFEADLEQMKAKVENMTKRMEEGMRKMIDGQHAVQAMKDTIEGAAVTARADASTQATTINTRSQGRRRRGDDGEEGEEENEEEEYQEFTPTDPAGGTQPVASVSESWLHKIDDEKTRYQNYTLSQRYAKNNNYRNFKGIVHTSRYPEGEVELPHESTWFNAAGAAPEPGVTGAGPEDSDEDDDIQIQRAKTSTKCPLTLQEFRNPLTSTKCKHSFEASAILEMLKLSNDTVGGKPGPRGRTVGGEKAVRCPVASCDSMLTKGDLHKDMVIVHQIARLQRARRLEEEEDEEGDESSGRPRPELIDSDAPDIDDYEEPQPVKKEPRGSARSRATASAAPRASSGADSDGDEPMEMW